MKIEIFQENRKCITLALPSGIVLNRMTAPVIAKRFRRKEIPLTAEQLKHLFRAVHAYKKAHEEWVFLEAEFPNGSVVRMKI